MEFTYKGYQKLLELVVEHGYQISNYNNWQKTKRCVIFRHDIDYDLDKAVRLAEMESIRGVSSTYFVLLTSDLYNAFSTKSRIGLKQIVTGGHTIGLHFDEVCYPELSGDVEAIKRKIKEEAEILSGIIEKKVDVVSMHRPSKFILEADIGIPGMINSYGSTYFKEFKYLSDSRRRWREPVEKIILSEKYERLHVLTHAFWYNESEKNIHETVTGFINSGNYTRYQIMETNITDLRSVMCADEVIGKETAI
jgi:hypothetical protein